MHKIKTFIFLIILFFVVNNIETVIWAGDFSNSLTSLSSKDSKVFIDKGYSLTIHVNLVNLFVTVANKRGRPIKNLWKRNFKLWEDGVLQKIKYFATYRDAGLSVAILLDISGSMALMNKYTHCKEALHTLVESMKPADELALFTFADGVVHIMEPFTRDKNRILIKARKITPFGKTALYWAIDMMPRIMGKPKNRQAILLLTDGIDNLSKISFQDMLRNSRNTKVPIYTLGFSNSSLQKLHPTEEYSRISILRTVALQTGGDYFQINTSKDIEKAMKKITNELRFQYLIGYNSNQHPKPGSYHKIRLQTLKKKYIVKVRKGYYVSSK